MHHISCERDVITTTPVGQLDVLLGGGRRGRILRGDPFHSVGTRIG